MLSVSEAAKAFGISRSTILGRIWRKWPEEKLCDPQILRPPAKRNYKRLIRKKTRYITPWGRKSIEEIAEILRLKPRTVINRLYQRKWTEEEAFNTPAFFRRGSGFVMHPEEYAKRVAEVIKKEELNDSKPNV